MLEFISDLLSSDFMPHGHCFQWDPQILAPTYAVVVFSLVVQRLTLAPLVRRVVRAAKSVQKRRAADVMSTLSLA